MYIKNDGFANFQKLYLIMLMRLLNSFQLLLQLLQLNHKMIGENMLNDFDEKEIRNSVNFCEQIKTCVEKFTALLNQIKKTDWQKQLQKSLRQWKWKTYKLQDLNLKNVEIIYFTLTSKYKKFNQTEASNRSNWLQNQLRIFIWILAIVPQLFLKSITEFTFSEYSRLSEVFFGISPDFCHYQVNTLTNFDSPQNWTKEEQELLSKIVGSNNQNLPWNTISKELFYYSNKKFFKTPNSCRQRWGNHLNKNIIKGCWTTQQDYQIIKNINKYGKKWATITKKMKSVRTQHMIKNRFLTILKRQSRKKSFKKCEQPQICLQIQKKLFGRLKIDQQIVQKKFEILKNSEETQTPIILTPAQYIEQQIRQDDKKILILPPSKSNGNQLQLIQRENKSVHVDIFQELQILNIMMELHKIEVQKNAISYVLVQDNGSNQIKSLDLMEQQVLFLDFDI